MNANDVIESYVTDVAVQLPRRQRDDVAFELRELLHEELQSRAEMSGRPADDAMALDIVRAFGQPGDVAARYRPPLTIIDPAEGRSFLQATVIGLVLLWALGLLDVLREHLPTGWDLLVPLSRWWLGTVIPSLWWPGVLVVSFGTAAWARRRWPRTAEWKPRPADRVPGGRAAMVLALAGILLGVIVLFDPRAALALVTGGRLAPAAYEAFTYTETFRQRQAPYLLVLLLLYVPMYASVVATGRWYSAMRRVEFEHGLVTSLVIAWTALAGPVFVAPESDRMARSLLALILAYTLLELGLGRLRRVRPAPDLAPRSPGR